MAESEKPQNMVQAAGQVASDVVGSFKNSPILLLLLLFNVAFVAVVYYTAADTRERQGEMVKHLLANQEKMQELLSRCTGRSAVEWPNIGGLPPEEGDKS